MISTDALNAIQRVLDATSALVIAERRFEEAKILARDAGCPEQAIRDAITLIETAAAR